MSNFLIPSWDDLGGEAIAVAAAESIKALDTTEALKELDEKQEQLARQKQLKEAGLAPLIGSPLTTPMNPKQLNDANSTLFERAMAAVVEMDKYLEDGGRVSVSEKYLLNCKADLNQLVPFKYPWAWSLYLTGTEQHWMPGEFSLVDAAASFNTIVKGTPKKMLARLYMSYRYREMIMPDQVLLNCYRLITNPECRQYILRQGFESVLIKHFLADLIGVFNIKNMMVQGSNILSDQYAIDGDTFKERYRVAVGATRDLHDFTFDTMTGIEDTVKFIEQLTYVYGYVNWIMQIVPVYQMLVALKNAGQMELGLARVLLMLIRDMQTQTKFITSFLNQAFIENPMCLTADFKEIVKRQFKRFIVVEQDLASTLANSDTEYRDVMGVVEYYTSRFLNDIGIEMERKQVNPNAEWFVDLAESLQPHISLEAGLSGQGGNLEF